MNRKYYSLEKFDETATLTIYGEITSFPWFEGDVSSANLSKQLAALGDVKQIDVYINSYGGEVAEGLAIYNALKRHKAKIRTICDGFACSIASVIFMAGDERVMNESSLLMIHNAWTFAEGNAEALRKQADDLEKITQASVEAYKAHSSLTEDEIRALMDAESWILPDEAISYGFATSVEKTEKAKTSQNAWKQLFDIVKKFRASAEGAENPDDDNDDDEQEDPEKDPDKPPNTEDGDDPDKGDSDEDDPANTDEENPDDESEDDDQDDKPPVDNTEKPAQMWSGFFNSLLKM